jgi:hypothetical protein
LVCLSSLSGCKQGDTLKARKLELVDKDGKTRVRIAEEEGAFDLRFYGKKGKVSQVIMGEEPGGGVSSVTVGPQWETTVGPTPG